MGDSQQAKAQSGGTEAKRKHEQSEEDNEDEENSDSSENHGADESAEESEKKNSEIKGRTKMNPKSGSIPMIHPFRAKKKIRKQQKLASWIQRAKVNTNALSITLLTNHLLDERRRRRIKIRRRRRTRRRIKTGTRRR